MNSNQITISVNFYATLRPIVGGKTKEFQIKEGGTVRNLMDEIIQFYPALQKELFDDEGELLGYVHIIVNGRDVQFLENAFETPLTPEDSISIFPAVGGG